MKAIATKHSKNITILFLLTLLVFISVPALALSNGKNITNQDTLARMNSGNLILIDIREEREWKASGVAKGSITMSMNNPKFLDAMTKLRAENPDKILAFICASGRRSDAVQARLVELGFENVYSVTGGTTGNGVAG